MSPGSLPCYGLSAASVAELLQALRDESDALKAGDAARLAAAESRKRHLLRMLTAGASFVGGTVS